MSWCASSVSKVVSIVPLRTRTGIVVRRPRPWRRRTCWKRALPRRASTTSMAAAGRRRWHSARREAAQSAWQPASASVAEAADLTRSECVCIMTRAADHIFVGGRPVFCWCVSLEQTACLYEHAAPKCPHRLARAWPDTQKPNSFSPFNRRPRTPTRRGGAYDFFFFGREEIVRRRTSSVKIRHCVDLAKHARQFWMSAPPCRHPLR